MPLSLAAGAVAVARFEPLRRALLPPEPAGEAKLRTVIPDLRIDADSLSAAMEQVGRQAATPIHYTPVGADDVPQVANPASGQITFELRNVTLGEALDSAMAAYCETAGEYTSDGQTVLVAPAAAPNGGPTVVRAYDVSDLIPRANELVSPRREPSAFHLYMRREPRERRTDGVEEAVRSQLRIYGDEPDVTSFGTYLVVKGTAREQAEASRLIGVLRSARREGATAPLRGRRTR